jgi:hypothetical protein
MNSATDALPDLLRSRARLGEAFETGLLRMLDSQSLGAFVLVLANASYEAAMLARLQPSLRGAFDRWRAAAEADAAAFRSAAPDDVAVFRQLPAGGPDAVSSTRWRRVGPWELQFNPLRALRPPRGSGREVTRLRQPFDPQGFHFDKPFLRDEILWEGAWSGVPLRLLFNKFPFAEHHALLVPDPAAGRPQFLQPDDHRLIWAFSEVLAPSLPGIGFGYNAYGAFASINHLHFQMFERSSGVYPIESPDWQHNGGPRPYPLPVRRLDDVDAAWAAVQRLQAADRAFNLLYRPGRLYLVERALQGSYAHSGWTAGFAWSELAGAVTVFREADFERLGEADLEQEFRRLRP